MLLKDYLLSEFIIPIIVVGVIILSMASCPMGFGGDVARKTPHFTNDPLISESSKKSLIEERGLLNFISKSQNVPYLRGVLNNRMYKKFRFLRFRNTML